MDYFKCEKCKYKKEVNKELVNLVNDLLKTQREILKYIDLKTDKKVSGVNVKK
tara:strand:- start:505 stop:663 length:159 start_codon:yes stop_codon:yes gene_type:complete